MTRLRERIAGAPEIAVPIGVLVSGLVVLGVAMFFVRPTTTVAAALISAAVAGYGTVLSVIFARYFERRKEAALRLQEVDREARAKKIPEYEKFVAFLFDMFMAENMGKKAMNEQQVKRGVLDWTKPLLLWGSDEVVRRWGRLRLGMGAGGTESLFRLEELLLELRRDVGYPVTSLKRGDLLRLWVNDIDEYIGSE